MIECELMSLNICNQIRTMDFYILWQCIVQFSLAAQVILWLLFFSTKLKIYCYFFLEAFRVRLCETTDKNSPVYNPTNQLPLWLLPVLSCICPVTECISHILPTCLHATVWFINIFVLVGAGMWQYQTKTKPHPVAALLCGIPLRME